MTFKRLLCQTQSLFVMKDTRIASYVSILSGLGWGLGLMFPGDTLARPTYRFMNDVAPEAAWAIWFVLVAVLQGFRLYQFAFTPNSRMLGFRWFDLGIRFCAMVTWTFVAIACLASQWPIAVAMFDTMIVAMFAWWDFARYDTPSNELRIRRTLNGDR